VTQIEAFWFFGQSGYTAKSITEIARKMLRNMDPHMMIFLLLQGATSMRGVAGSSISIFKPRIIFLSFFIFSFLLIILKKEY
jgi:hypothetical protein